MIKFYLVQAGVDPERFIIKPMGEFLANQESKGKEKKDSKYRRGDITVQEESPGS